jgi:superfamily I DNA/RNA helicase
VTAEQLVDQAGPHGDGLTTAERAASDRTWIYGHVVVDEAQELSAMQWRVLVRRCPMKSFTIVGDIAQSSSAHGGRSWADAVGPFFKDHWRLEELTVNYRTPALIARPAERFARSQGLPITPARAVREGDWPVREVVVDSGAHQAADPSAQVAQMALVDDRKEPSVRPEPAGRGIGGAEALVATVVHAVEHDRGIDGTGTLAVIASLELVDAVSDAVSRRYGAHAGRGASGLAKPIVVLTAQDAKGLEFDAVVIADPDAIVAESPRGASALYVAMTRPTQRLTLVRPGTAG